MATVVVPRFFKEHKEFNLLELDDCSGVVYSQCNDQRRNEVSVTCHLFVYVLSGAKIIHTPAGDYRIGAGAAFIARRGSYLFSEILADADQYKSLIFFMDDRFLSDFIRINASHLRPAAPRPVNQDFFRITVSPLMAACVEATVPFFANKSDVSRDLLKLKLTEILHHVACSSQGASFMSFIKSLKDTGKLDLLPFMEENFTKPLSLENLALLSGRSLTTFKRDFKKTFNRPPKQWITEKRLERAKALLAYSGLNVTDVCFAVGFENISYFGQLFKKRFGLSPKKVQMTRNQEKLDSI